MPIEQFRKALEKKPSRREQEENRIEHDLGPEYLEFAKDFEKRAADKLLENFTAYPEGLTRKEKIWYISCVQTYFNFYKERFANKLYPKHIPNMRKLALEMDYADVLSETRTILKKQFKQEEIRKYDMVVAQLLKEVSEGMDLTNYDQRIQLTRKLVDPIEEIVGALGVERYTDWYKLRLGGSKAA